VTVTAKYKRSDFHHARECIDALPAEHREKILAGAAEIIRNL